jgi:hypothetical protein
MTPNPALRRPIRPAHEIPASDGFGPLPHTPRSRNRCLTRGLCTFLGWPYRRTPKTTQLSQLSLHPVTPVLRAVNE